VVSWIKSRLRTFALLPDYFGAIAQRWQDILWGASMPAIVIVIWSAIWGVPTPIIVVFLVLAMFIAGYYAWRADHERFLPRLEVVNKPRIQTTPVMTSMGYDTGQQLTYLQVVPRCATDSPVRECQGHLLRVSKVAEGEWVETALNETLPLEWSLRKEPAVTLYPGIEQRLNVCFWGMEKGITPATTTLPLRWHSVVNGSGIFRFDIRIISADSAPVDVFVVVTLDDCEWNDPLAVVSTTTPPLASCTQRAPLPTS
jgi:hypothetical protein